MPRLTTERVATLFVLGLVFLIAAQLPVDPDLWWHLRAGSYLLDHGIIRTDPFSFTAQGKAWIDHSWGAQVVMSEIWSVAGRWGLALFTGLLAVFGMWLTHRQSAGSAGLRAPVLLLGAMSASIFWTPRPQMFTFVLAALLLWILHLHKRGGIDRLWWVPVLMALWANLHAGFAIGFIVLIGSIAGEAFGGLVDPDSPDRVPVGGVRKLVIVTLASVVAVCANPYGWRILAVPFQTARIGALHQYIAEWRSPDFHQHALWPFALLLVTLIGVLGLSRRRLDWTDLFLTAGTAVMALLAVRNVAICVLVAVPVIARTLVGIAEDQGWALATRPTRVLTGGARVLGWMLAVLMVAACGNGLARQVSGPGAALRTRQVLPVAAADHLASLPAGRMFNSYNFGGYLMFRLPDRLVFADGRTDLYGDRFLAQDYLPTAQAEPGWQATLDRYRIDVVVMETDSALARALSAEPGWSENYHDDVAAIFVRTP